MERLPQAFRGNQSVQSRALRDASGLFGLSEFASDACIAHFTSKFGGIIREWTPKELRTLALYGNEAANSFWADVSDFVNQVTLFTDACRQSMLGKGALEPQVDTLISDIVDRAG